MKFRGFTLLEMLVVVIVAGILMSYMFAGMAKMRADVDLVNAKYQVDTILQLARSNALQLEQVSLVRLEGRWGELRTVTPLGIAFKAGWAWHDTTFQDALELPEGLSLAIQTDDDIPDGTVPTLYFLPDGTSGIMFVDVEHGTEKIGTATAQVNIASPKLNRTLTTSVNRNGRIK